MPGAASEEDIIRDTKDGVIMENNKSWSIDQKRLNFQFGCEIGWLVKNGKKTTMVKNPTYQGITPEFWNSCDAIADENNTDPAMLLQEDDLYINMDDWLAQLNDKQREVVERRFGLHGHKTATLEQVGNEIGLTRERVRQIQMDALKRLRRILESEGFTEDAMFG